MFRKFRADRIFTGRELLGGDHVLITGEDGRIEAVMAGEDVGEEVESFSGWLVPGFVNAHCHLDLSHLKGRIPEGEGLLNFIRRVMAGRYDGSEEEKNKAMLLAADEMLRNGIVAIGDICTGAASLEIKKFSSLQWVNFIELTGMSTQDAGSRFEKARLVRSAFEESLPEFQSAFSPHAPYSVSPRLMQMLNEKSKDEVIAVHNQESPEENLLFQNKGGGFISLYEEMGIDISDFEPTGKNSLPGWGRYFNQDQRIISVHNTFSETNDIEYTKNREGQAGFPKYYFCLCPGANLYIERSMPPVLDLIESRVRIVLGTDSLASNGCLSILEEMKLLSKYFHLPLEQMLSWATINGAQALGIDKNYGSFEKGKKPGVLLITNPSETAGAGVKRLL